MARSLSAFVFVVLATVVAPPAIAANWLTSTVDDRQSYVDTVAPLADEPAVRHQMAEAAAAAAVASLEEKIPIGLPDAVSQWATSSANSIVESPQFPALWRTANESVHDDVIRLLQDPDASTDGFIEVDATPIVAQVLLQVEEKGVPIGGLQAPHVEVPVVPESKVAEIGPEYRAAHDAARWLVIGWVGLVVIALVVASGWRARLRVLGLALLGVALAAVLVGLAVDQLTDLAVERVADGNQVLVDVMLRTIGQSLSPYADGFRLAAIPGVLLLVATLWPARNPRKYDEFVAYPEPTP